MPSVPKSPLSRSLAVMVRTGVPAMKNILYLSKSTKVFEEISNKNNMKGGVIMQNSFAKQPSVYLRLDLNGLIWIAHEATLVHSE